MSFYDDDLFPEPPEVTPCDPMFDDIPTKLYQQKREDEYNQWFFNHYKNIMGEEFLKNENDKK